MHYHNQSQLGSAAEVVQTMTSTGAKQVRLNTRVRKVEGVKVKMVEGALVFDHGGRTARIQDPPDVVVQALKGLGKLDCDKNGTFAIHNLSVEDPFTKIAVGDLFIQMRLLEVAKQSSVVFEDMMGAYPPSYDTDAFDMKRYKGDSSGANYSVSYTHLTLPTKRIV
eukprot:TRINITY_DN28478_c0_g1_i1.p1 TRINITY_DN28478_c0_g1~~TRINITY_DN28478_c0_g1_i1.p1  ORF type:complete len:166 (+),score=39.72 TRINITY_DN28478_c0_g1_i1:193-690(+)